MAVGVTNPADEIATLADELGELLAALAALLPEPVADPATGTTTTHRGVTGSPAPWHAEAAGILFDVHEGIRRLEASIRRDITGRPGRRRGGSDRNTAAALAAVASLAYGLDVDAARRARRILNVWASHARQIRDIDREPAWAPLPSVPGRPPAACPYCRTYSLRYARLSGAVRCANPRCADSEGSRPYGVIEQGKYTGRAMLVFADGREITYTTEVDIMTKTEPTRVDVTVLLTIGDDAEITTPGHNANDPIRVPAATIAAQTGIDAKQLPGKKLTALVDEQAGTASEFRAA